MAIQEWREKDREDVVHALEPEKASWETHQDLSFWRFTTYYIARYT